MMDSRIDSVTELGKERQRVTELETQLAEAKKDSKKAYVRSTKDSWSTEEHKKLGLDQQAATRRLQTAKKPIEKRPATTSVNVRRIQGFVLDMRPQRWTSPSVRSLFPVQPANTPGWNAQN